MASRKNSEALRQRHKMDLEMAASMEVAFKDGLGKNLGRGLVLGAYEPPEKDGDLILTPSAKKFDRSINGKLLEKLAIVGRKLKPGKSRVLYGMGGGYTTVAIANLGKEDSGFCPLNVLDKKREAVRAAVASACTQLREVGETQVEVDPCNDAEAAAEGGTLSLFSYDDLKAKDKRKSPVILACQTSFLSSDGEANGAAWERGKMLAEGQNLARRLMETPSNKMTPKIFSEEVVENLKHTCSVIVRDREWAEKEKMGAFMAVAQGSTEPLQFLEVYYHGAASSDPYVALVGKGVTFDSGGISLKPPTDMDKMRADMGGAACVVGAIQAASQLKLPINIIGLIALCENMPSGHAIKPGDVVTAKNGKTIQIDNTDAEGRLILADTLCYADTFNHSVLLDIATLTGAIEVALGAGAAGAFTNCNATWDLLQQAGCRTGDRLWRMPLFSLYKNHITTSQLADLNNIGKYSRCAGSCTAAAFLKEFVTSKHWVHLDIAGVMMNKDEVPYLNKGMSGRPTRTIVEFLEIFSKQKA